VSPVVASPRGDVDYVYEIEQVPTHDEDQVIMLTGRINMATLFSGEQLFC